jgi:large subunit ribosomal protein L29
MNIEKIRNLTEVELNHQQRELSDQLFKMKFQLKMGQTESLKKIRELKKDIARVKTVMRQQQMAAGNGAAVAQPEVASVPAPAEKPARRGLLRRKSK